MIGAVYKTCREGGQLLCQAPTGIGKTMSVLFPALKALEDGGPVFYLTARGTTRAAAENAVAVLHDHDTSLKLRSVTLTAKDKICLQDRRECTPEACPYANGYFDRVKTALWDGLDTPTLTAAPISTRETAKAAAAVRALLRAEGAFAFLSTCLTAPAATPADVTHSIPNRADHAITALPAKATLTSQ